MSSAVRIAFCEFLTRRLVASCGARYCCSRHEPHTGLPAATSATLTRRTCQYRTFDVYAMSLNDTNRWMNNEQVQVEVKTRFAALWRDCGRRAGQLGLGSRVSLPGPLSWPAASSSCSPSATCPEYRSNHHHPPLDAHRHILPSSVRLCQLPEDQSVIAHEALVAGVKLYG